VKAAYRVFDLLFHTNDADDSRQIGELHDWACLYGADQFGDPYGRKHPEKDDEYAEPFWLIAYAIRRASGHQLDDRRDELFFKGLKNAVHARGRDNAPAGWSKLLPDDRPPHLHGEVKSRPASARRASRSDLGR